MITTRPALILNCTPLYERALILPELGHRLAHANIEVLSLAISSPSVLEVEERCNRVRKRSPCLKLVINIE